MLRPTHTSRSVRRHDRGAAGSRGVRRRVPGFHGGHGPGGDTAGFAARRAAARAPRRRPERAAVDGRRARDHRPPEPPARARRRPSRRRDRRLQHAARRLRRHRAGRRHRGDEHGGADPPIARAALGDRGRRWARRALRDDGDVPRASRRDPCGARDLPRRAALGRHCTEARSGRARRRCRTEAARRPARGDARAQRLPREGHLAAPARRPCRLGAVPSPARGRARRGDPARGHAGAPRAPGARGRAGGPAAACCGPPPQARRAPARPAGHRQDAVGHLPAGRDARPYERAAHRPRPRAHRAGCGHRARARAGDRRLRGRRPRGRRAHDGLRRRRRDPLRAAQPDGGPRGGRRPALRADHEPPGPRRAGAGGAAGTGRPRPRGPAARRGRAPRPTRQSARPSRRCSTLSAPPGCRCRPTSTSGSRVPADAAGAALSSQPPRPHHAPAPGARHGRRGRQRR
ncbi:MAG: hypothetical protein V7607_4860 [Solirubrobacteraceae bacterium]